MVEFLPAIMPDSLSDWQEKALRVKGLLKWAQIDVMDGVFVPATSWPYYRGQESEFETLISEEQGMPLWQDFNYEVDLMVSKPERVIEDWIALGVRRIIVHIESTKKMQDIIDLVREKTGEKGSTWRVELGIAINTTTPLSSIEDYIDQVDVVQCMGIEKIGYQGNPFDERVLTHVSQLREKYPELIISIDGSVNSETVGALTQHGANRLVVGSALVGVENPKEALHTFKQNVHV